MSILDVVPVHHNGTAVVVRNGYGLKGSVLLLGFYFKFQCYILEKSVIC